MAAKEIENVVRSSVDVIGEGRFRTITCGSYRRGRKVCGDVDMIFTANREYTQGERLSLSPGRTRTKHGHHQDAWRKKRIYRTVRITRTALLDSVELLVLSMTVLIY